MPQPRRVEFTSEGETIAADLYLPDQVAGPLPIVVMAGGWCYVKELIQPHYGAFFNAAGFATLIFDYRRFGDSTGTPRQHIDPNDQIEDYRNAISFVATLPEVDPHRIGVWGISYSGGHALVLAATDNRIRSVVSNIPVVDGYRNMRRVHGTVGFRNLMHAVREDREIRYQTGQGGMIKHATLDYATELSTWPFPETYETFLDLKQREAPAYENWSTVHSVELLMSYDVRPFLERILDTPTLVVVAEEDDLTLWDLEIAAYNAIPTTKKRLIVVPGSTHMTLYSDLTKLEIAAGGARDWFLETL
jgi:cephalosporin-C deacetylase-like acetyl esterase